MDLSTLGRVGIVCVHCAVQIAHRDVLILEVFTIRLCAMRRGTTMIEDTIPNDSTRNVLNIVGITIASIPDLLVVLVVAIDKANRNAKLILECRPIPSCTEVANRHNLVDIVLANGITSEGIESFELPVTVTDKYDLHVVLR